MIRNSVRFTAPRYGESTYELLQYAYPIVAGAVTVLQSQIQHVATRTVPIATIQPPRVNVPYAPESDDDLPQRQTCGRAYLQRASDFTDCNVALGACQSTAYANQVKGAFDVQLSGPDDLISVFPQESVRFNYTAGNGAVEDSGRFNSFVRANRLNLAARVSASEYIPTEYAALLYETLGLFGLSSSDCTDGFVTQTRARAWTRENSPSVASSVGTASPAQNAPTVARIAIPDPGFSSDDDRFVLVHTRLACLYTAPLATTQVA
jgi:hypothetical protein